MTGQSNMDGTVNGNLSPAMDFDKVSNGTTVATHQADKNVLMWDFSSPMTDVSLDPNSSNSTWRAMHAYGDNGNSGDRWGPEIGMARTMYNAGARDFAIVKVAQSGMPNEAWVRYADASGKVISNPNVAYQNCYYDLYCSVVKALANLPAGYTSVEIAGMGYLQGEGNGQSGAESSSLAPGLTAERLGDLVTNLKSDLGKLSTNEMSVKADGMKLVIGQIGENSSWLADQKANAKVTDAQHKEYAKSHDDTTFVAGRGLPAAGGVAGDVHYSGGSQIVLGERFADAFLNLGTYEKATTTELIWKGGSNVAWNSGSWGGGG